MEYPSPQKRSALHRRRGLRLARDATAVSNTVTPTSQLTSASQDATTTASDNGLIPDLLTGLGLSIPSTSQKPSSTTSATTVPATSSVTTHSLPTTSLIPTSTTPPPASTFETAAVVVDTTTTFPSSTSTSAPAESSGVSTVTIISGITGALGGTILLTVIIGFFLRRWRKRKSAADAFDASQFKDSAVLLSKDDISRGRPRPPSMIERRNAVPIAPLSAPSAAYPYSDQSPQHGMNHAQYGAVPLQPPSFAAGNPGIQYGANPYAMEYTQEDPFASHTAARQSYEQPGYGAPPIPGTHSPGTYAPYGVDPRYPQYHQRPPQYQQHGFGQAVDTVSGASLERASSLTNPFSLPEEMRLNEGSGSLSTSTSSTVPSKAGLTRGGSLTTRQSTQSYEAPPVYMNGDVSLSTSSSS